MQRLRDNPASADQEYDRLLDADDPGLLGTRLTFAPDEDVTAPFVAHGQAPRLAVLREQGVNGQVEMAAAFDRAGFEAVADQLDLGRAFGEGPLDAVGGARRRQVDTFPQRPPGLCEWQRRRRSAFAY